MTRLHLLLVCWLLVSICRFTSAAPPEVKPADLPRTAPTSADQAVETFAVRPGFRLELMAAEPLIADPIAIAFDEDARAYVVEMRDYSEHREKKLGRVKLLHDDNGDGKFDRSSIFADNLSWPTAVACWDGGVFLVATPDLLYLKDTDHDGRADVRAIVFQGFGNLVEKLNVQALPNSLTWGPDQRLHLALGGNASKLSNFAFQKQPAVELRGRDLSFDPRQLDLRAEPGGGQWGLTFDDLGRKYLCSNSRHIQQSIFPEYALRLNPSLPPTAADIAEDGPQAEVYRSSPVEPWRILRTQWRVAGVVPGMIEGGGRASGYFTSACGITIYRGDAYPAEYQGNAFIADCGSNLIHRKTMSGEVRRSARRATDEQTREFVTSRDNWFRPVALANAPDGCLWVCDMYREIVEHPWSIPEPIKSLVDLDAGNDRGRLWRIVPEGFQPRPTNKLSMASTAELVRLLEHRNGWQRDTAARLIHQRQDVAAIPLLEKLLSESTLPAGRIATLRVLAGLLPAENIPWLTALAERDVQVRAAALTRLGSAFELGKLPEHLRPAVARLASDEDAEIRFRVALLLPHWPAADRRPMLLSLAGGNVSSADLRQILASLAGDFTAEIWRQAVAATNADQQRLAVEMTGQLGKRAQPAEFAVVFDTLRNHPQQAMYLQALADGARRAGKSVRDVTPAGELQTQANLSLQTLRQSKRTAAERTQALQILGLVGTSDLATEIAERVSPQLTRAEATATVEALDRLQPPELAKIYTKLWPQLPADVRPALLQAWRGRKALIPALLTAITNGTIPKEEISTTDLAALRETADPAVQRQVEQLFGPLGTREAALAAFRNVHELPGSAVAGAVVFQAKCASCHRKQGIGNAVGPDLDAAASAGKEKLLTNILDPSREVTAGYVTGIVSTIAGEVISGVIVAEADGGVTLKIPSHPPRTIAKAEIETFKRSPKSLMPEGIETGLSKQDIANVLEYLVSSKGISPRLPLTHYRTADGKIEPIQSLAQWEQRRADILARMQEIMGPFPGKEKRVPLEPRIEEEVDCGTYIRRLVTYVSEPGNRVPAYLLVPKKLLEPKATKTPAILCLHPTDNAVGHKVVVGLGGKANRQYAAELAERGFVTLAPAYPLLANYQPELENLGYSSGTMKAIWDNSRGLDYLESLPFVTPRFGAIGHSLGGHNSVYTAVFDQRIRAVVSSCGLDSYQDYMRGNITGWTSTRYMPKLAAFKGRAGEIPFDFDELLAAIAPRGVSIVAPLKDDNFRAESVDRVVANAKHIFNLYETPRQLSVEHPDCGHDFPDDARARAYRFLAEQLQGE